MEIPVFCCCWTTRTHTRFQNTEIDISGGFYMQATIADNRISLINYALPVPGAREMCSLQSLRAEQGSSEQLPRDWQLEAATDAGMTVSGARPCRPCDYLLSTRSQRVCANVQIDPKWRDFNYVCSKAMVHGPKHG